MRCPEHPDIWLYENMMETKGFCPDCQQWYSLETGDPVEPDKKGKNIK